MMSHKVVRSLRLNCDIIVMSLLYHALFMCISNSMVEDFFGQIVHMGVYMEYSGAVMSWYIDGDVIIDFGAASRKSNNPYLIANLKMYTV